MQVDFHYFVYRGVVQLFNAVKQQQTDISKKLSEAGPLERKREQVMKNIDKNAFLDILMGKAESISVDNTVEPEKTVETIGNKDKVSEVFNLLLQRLALMFNILLYIGYCSFICFNKIL